MSTPIERNQGHTPNPEYRRKFIFSNVTLVPTREADRLTLGRCIEGSHAMPEFRSGRKILKLPFGASAEFFVDDTGGNRTTYLLQYMRDSKNQGKLPYIAVNFGGEVDLIVNQTKKYSWLRMIGGGYSQIDPWSQDSVQIGSLPFSCLGKRVSI